MQNKQGSGWEGLAKTSGHSPLSGWSAHLLTLSADLDGIGDQLGRLFLLQTRHFLQLDRNLETKGQSEEARARPARSPSLTLSRLTVVSQRKMLL